MTPTSLHPVTLARYYKGLTQAQLASKLGRSQSFVARLELGELEVGPIAHELADALRMPTAFFAGDHVWPAVEGAITFRKRADCPASIRNRARFYAHVAHALVAPFIEEYVDVPAPNIPQVPMDLPADNVQARSQGAAAARAVRAAWGIGWGPITSVMRLLESQGVRVYYVDERVEHLDGFACWIQDTPYLFINRAQDPARERHDLCHELGHLVMHRDISLDARTDMAEAMAHGFAAEFLAPWESFSKEAPVLVDMRHLGRLRSRWKMSMQSIVMHMRANGAITDAAYANAFRRFSVLGYRRGPEPVWFPPDTSVVHLKFLDVLTQRGLNAATLAEARGIPETLLEKMVPASSAPLGNIATLGMSIGAPNGAQDPFG